MAGRAELIFTGGRVHTVNATDDVVEAVALGGGRILAVGASAAIRGLGGPGTREIDLRGRSLLPGFIDAHAHFASLGMSAMAIDGKAPGMRSIAALQAAVGERAAAQAALPSAGEYRHALRRANAAYLAAGGTSVHDAGGLVGPAFAPCQDLVASGEIRVRLYAFATVNSLAHPLLGLLASGVRTGLGNERLRLGAFKVMTDGSSSGPTAATREPYTSDCHDSGILYWTQDDLDGLLGRAHRQGFQCTVHAVGDRAIEQTLDALARAQREFPRPGLRHRIEHCGICPPDLQARVHGQGIVPAMQPAFFWEFGDGYIRNYGRPRADTMFPARSLIARGVPVAGSSDAPVTHHAPLFGIEQALTRATMDGDVCGPDERVDLATAVRMHTINGAHAAFEEGLKGSLEPGKLADMVMLAEDLTRVPAREVRQVGVVMTLIGGEVVYEG